MAEKLRYIKIDRHRGLTIAVSVTGDGGRPAQARFDNGITAEAAVRKLRRLADCIEDGVQLRQHQREIGNG